MGTSSDSAMQGLGSRVNIRSVVESDLAAVAALDESVTGIGKSDYWRHAGGYSRFPSILELACRASANSCSTQSQMNSRKWASGSCEPWSRVTIGYIWFFSGAKA